MVHHKLNAQLPTDEQKCHVFRHCIFRSSGRTRLQTVAHQSAAEYFQQSFETMLLS